MAVVPCLRGGKKKQRFLGKRNGGVFFPCRGRGKKSSVEVVSGNNWGIGRGRGEGVGGVGGGSEDLLQDRRGVPKTHRTLGILFE